jgi:hypothetical protein
MVDVNHFQPLDDTARLRLLAYLHKAKDMPREDRVARGKAIVFLPPGESIALNRAEHTAAFPGAHEDWFLN